jgi:archaellum component FlaC
MIGIVISIIGMWLLNKHHKKSEKKHTERVKQLSCEWETLSNELTVLQSAIELEQIAYNHALQTLVNQRSTTYEYSMALTDLKLELANCLRMQKIDVLHFKELSEDCIEAYLTYEQELQKSVDIEKEFNEAYLDWDEKCDGRFKKINDIRTRIKGIETEIKNICSDV